MGRASEGPEAKLVLKKHVSTLDELKIYIYIKSYIKKVIKTHANIYIYIYIYKYNFSARCMLYSSSHAALFSLSTSASPVLCFVLPTPRMSSSARLPRCAFLSVPCLGPPSPPPSSGILPVHYRKKIMGFFQPSRITVQPSHSITHSGDPPLAFPDSLPRTLNPK